MYVTPQMTVVADCRHRPRIDTRVKRSANYFPVDHRWPARRYDGDIWFVAAAGATFTIDMLLSALNPVLVPHGFFPLNPLGRCRVYRTYITWDRTTPVSYHKSSFTESHRTAADAQGGTKVGPVSYSKNVPNISHSKSKAKIKPVDLCNPLYIYCKPSTHKNVGNAVRSRAGSGVACWPTPPSEFSTFLVFRIWPLQTLLQAL